jgi:TolB protein
VVDGVRVASTKTGRQFSLALILLAVALVAAAAARSNANIERLRNGSLTILTMPAVRDAEGVASVQTVGLSSRTLWRCPGEKWCGQVVSHDWAPDGKRIAVTLDALGGISPYVGMHVVDVASLRDLTIGELRAGCWPATDLDWSPDGSALAYRCGGGMTDRRSPRVHVLRISGSAGARVVPTPTPAYWPSWSPDGTRLAYSTTKGPNERSAIYTVSLDGSKRRLLAHGAAPAWSPAGNVIAYQTQCGIRLVTRAGKDATPRRSSSKCKIGFSIGQPGRPTWSPDGRKLAVETASGIWVMNADGTDLQRVSSKTSRAWYGSQPGRPSWRPSWSRVG